MILSNWKLTFGSTVLLAYNDELAEELRFPQALGTDVVPTPDSSWPLLLPTGNASVTLAFSVYTSASTDKEARAAILDSLVTVAGTGVSTLKIEVSGYTDRYWTFASCRIKDYEPYRPVEGNSALLVKRYSLVCAGLSRTGP